MTPRCAWWEARFKWVFTAMILFWLLVTTACVSTPNSIYSSQPTEITTIYLVRHAEKTSQGKDPDLSQVGMVRARKLAGLLHQASPDFLWSSRYNRTRQTLEPLAVANALSITFYDASDSAGLVTRINAVESGRTHVIAGHSNTVPELLDQFEVFATKPKFSSVTTPRPYLEHSDYSRLYILTIHQDGRVIIEERTY